MDRIQLSTIVEEIINKTVADNTDYKDNYRVKRDKLGEDVFLIRFADRYKYLLETLEKSKDNNLPDIVKKELFNKREDTLIEIIEASLVELYYYVEQRLTDEKSAECVHKAIDAFNNYISFLLASRGIWTQR